MGLSLGPEIRRVLATQEAERVVQPSWNSMPRAPLLRDDGCDRMLERLDGGGGCVSSIVGAQADAGAGRGAQRHVGRPAAERGIAEHLLLEQGQQKEVGEEGGGVEQGAEVGD